MTRRKLDRRLGYVVPILLVLMALLPRALFSRAEFELRFLTGRREVSGVWISPDRLVEIPTEEVPGIPEENAWAVDAYAAAHPEAKVYLAVVPGAARVLWGEAPEFPKAAAPVDLYAALTPHREEEIFFRTEDLWTPLGALYAWQAIAGEMDLEPGEFEPCLVSAACQGELAHRADTPWLFDDLRLYLPRTGVGCSPQIYDPAALDGDDPFRIFPTPGTELTTDACTCRSLLIIGGRPAGPLAALLYPAFDRVVISAQPTDATGFTHVLFLPTEEEYLTEHLFQASR